MKHLTPTGWKNCRATKRSCRYQQSEFSSQLESKGGGYYAAPVNSQQVASFIEDFRKSEPNWKTFEQKRLERDKEESFHVTVLTPRETRKLRKEGVKVEAPKFSFVPQGLGKVEEPGNSAYFVVLRSQEADDFRASLDLPPHNFHVTLGFEVRDIHDQPKDLSTIFDAK